MFWLSIWILPQSRQVQFFYNTTLTSNMIFIKYDASTINEKVEMLTREFNIQYRTCIGSFIYLLSTRVDFSFAVHKLSKFS